jgi:hypothetical protein
MVKELGTQLSEEFRVGRAKISRAKHRDTESTEKREARSRSFATLRMTMIGIGRTEEGRTMRLGRRL